MARMVRKQIYIQKRQETVLKKLARRRQVSEAELIREAIDRQIGEPGTRPSRPDPEAWEKAYQFMLARRKAAGSNGKPYRWKREDAYEDRLRRYKTE
jgi:hypothetical protein